jgi:hypothetical protein
LLASSFGFSWANVALPELLWALFGVVGFIFAMANYRESKADLEAIQAHEPIQGSLATIAAGHTRTELLRMVIHSISIAIGSLAMLTPPATPHPQITPVAIILTFGLFMINIITILQSVLDRQLRHLVERLEYQEGGEPHE